MIGCAIARARRAPHTAVIDDLDSVGFRAQPVAEVLVVVDGDDHLIGRRSLLLGGVDRVKQVLETLLAVTRDDDAGGGVPHARRLHSCNF